MLLSFKFFQQNKNTKFKQYLIKKKKKFRSNKTNCRLFKGMYIYVLKKYYIIKKSFPGQDF